MSIKINRLEEGHNFILIGIPTTCWNSVPPKETNMLPMRNSSILITCSLRQHILSHSFYDWKLCELFLLSGFLICHAVGWYIALTNQKFWWRIPKRKILISGYPKDL
jgi:hypothetical protein